LLAQGRYEILSLAGSHLPADGEDGAKQQMASLSVSLAGSDGRVFGGRVAGILTAASPIQVCACYILQLILRGVIKFALSCAL
jgi:hypothetical protein